MMILMRYNNPLRNEVMLVELESVCGQTLRDFMRKVPQHANDPLLRNQKYVHLCTKDGVILENTTSLKECFPVIRKDLYHVVIAIPHGNTCNEVLRFVQPILMDEKVNKMVG